MVNNYMTVIISDGVLPKECQASTVMGHSLCLEAIQSVFFSVDSVSTFFYFKGNSVATSFALHKLIYSGSESLNKLMMYNIAWGIMISLSRQKGITCRYDTY